MTSLRSGALASHTPRARLAELGLSLPRVSPPKGSYVPAVRSGTMVYVAGQVPMTDGELSAAGKVGAEVSPELAGQLARQCALAALAAIDEVADLDEVERVVRAIGYVACAEGFTGTTAVVTEVGELLQDVFGDAAPCMPVGVPCLPLNSPVEIELTVEISPR